LWALTLLAIAAGSALIPINSTMLAVALPAIMGDLLVDASTVSWLVTLYLAAVALAMPLAGSLGDRFGYRRMYLLGIAGFAVTSLAAALAQTFPLLVISRVLQAASGASITANAASLIRAIAPEDRRGGSYGLYDMLISTSAAVGPIAGGLLVAGFGWRSLFVVAVPIGLISGFVVAAIVAPRRRPATPGRRPLYRIDVRLFGERSFSAAVAATLGATVILHASLVLIPIVTQAVLRMSPAASGGVLLMLSGLGAVVAPIGGRLSDRVGRRLPAVVGSAVMTAGLAVLWLVTRSGITPAGLTAALALVGIGFGFGGSSRQAAAIESVPEHTTGVAAGTYFTSRYIGGVLGASLAGAVLAGGVGAPMMAGGFGLLAAVGVVVTLISFGLQGRRQTPKENSSL
jgi:MFS family permease